MLQLHYANRLENLVEPLAEVVELHQRRDPLVTLPIIVPNRSVEQFAKYEIAERLGVAANLKFPFLRRYLAEVAEGTDPKVRVIEVPRLQVLLFECLRSEALRTDSALRSVREYVMAANPSSDAIAELRLFELTGRIAHLFQEYSISRAPMLSAWSSASVPDKFEEEAWQRRLWAALFDRDGCARTSWTGDSQHRWMLLPQALASISDDRLRDALPPALHVFGLASPGRIFLEIFARLGRLTNLLVYALNPCMEFWEDVDTSAAARCSTWHHRGKRIGQALDDREDPFELVAPGDTRALQLWGRPGREYVRMLNELTECDFRPHFSRPIGNSLLSRLQRDILVRSVEGRGEHSHEVESRPASIRFVGTPGIQREAEIVANEIIRVVDADKQSSQRRPLRFHEIAVLVPDAAVDDYLPRIETVFTSRFGIPVEIAGPRWSHNRIAEGINLLLKFPLGRTTRDEMLRLLTHPAIAGAGHPDIDRLSAWCEELGVFFGTDASDLANTYVPANLFQWDQALTRIALGVFMGSDQERGTYPSEIGPLLPLAVPQDEMPAATRFLRTARSLLSDVREIRSRRMPFSDWAALIDEFITTYIEAPDDDAPLAPARYVEALESMGSLSTEPVGYEVAHSFVSGLFSEMVRRQGGFRRRGVAVGSLETLRSLPFRAIFVMGLNETTFPERDRREPIDLRLARRHPGDVSRPERDRYLFLESILSARDQITFSWVERDAQTGDRLEPSTTLRELQSILREYVGEDGVARLAVSHHLNRYEPADFRDLAEFAEESSRAEEAKERVSFDADVHRGARMLALRGQLAAAFPDQPLPVRAELFGKLNPSVRAKLNHSLGLFELPARSATTTDEVNLPIAAIRRFLECPVQGAARYALGIAEEDGAPEEATDEPIGLSRIDHAILLRDAFWRARGDPALFKRSYDEAIEIARMKGAAPAGPFGKAVVAADCERFARWCQELGSERGKLGEWQLLRIGRGDEFSRADCILPPLRLQVRVATADGAEAVRAVNLHGSLGAFSPLRDRSLRLVARSKAKPRDFLEMFIAAIALRAAGESIAPNFEALVLGDPTGTSNRAVASWKRTLLTPEPEAARSYLATLVGEMMSRAHDYFLPIEAVEKARHAMARGGDPLDEIDALREGFGPCSSDFGPIRNVKDLEPPDEDELAGIIERRFGVIDAIFAARDEA